MTTMSRGLPFQSLPAAGELGGPAFEMVDARGNITRAGTMVRDPQSGVLGPDYSDIGYDIQDTPSPPAGTAPEGQPSADPLTLIIDRGEQDMGQSMAAHDATIASIEAPTQQLLDVSYKQYQITTDAARRTGASNQDIDRITADYQKKWVAIKGKTELQVATATQAKAAARQELRLTQALQMGKAQNYLEMAQEGLIDDATARSRLFRLAGYDVPATSLRPQQGRQQDPFKTLQDNIKLIGQYDMQLKNKYRYDQKTGRLRVVKPQYLWQNPDANKPNEKHDTVPATWRDRGEFTRVQIFRERLAADNHQISAQRVGGRVVDIASAAGPLAHGITREKPRTQRQQPAPAELQRRGTREAYDLGIQLGYWQ